MDCWNSFVCIKPNYKISSRNDYAIALPSPSWWLSNKSMGFSVLASISLTYNRPINGKQHCDARPTHPPIFFQMGNCHFLCHCISFNVVIVTANIMLDPRKIFYSLSLWKMHASLEILIYGSIWKTVPSDIRIFSRLLRNDFKLQVILFGQCNSFHDLLS